MDELESRLRAVLDDPKAMAEVSSLAAGLLGGGGENAPAGPLPELLQTALKPHPLAAALGPYLREDRRRRLEQALGMAAAARALLPGLRGAGHGL